MLTNKATNVIPFYDSYGKQIKEISLKEKIIPIPNKRGGFAESGLYYKGAGIVYRNHLMFKREDVDERSICSEKFQIIGKTGLVYENLIVCYPDLIGKFGIFDFKHQPIFSDREGGCGRKEEKLVENFKSFELNAIDEIVDVIPTGINNTNIYCYKLREVKGNISDTIELIRYVLESDWNTAWDKNLWEDIESYGYVRDVADWFKSREYKHKLGTVFALLNSLYKINKSLYARLLIHMLGYYDFDKKHMLYMCAQIVNMYCKEYDSTKYNDIFIHDNDWFEILYKELVNGKACCHLENDEEWAWVREYLVKKELP